MAATSPYVTADAGAAEADVCSLRLDADYEVVPCVVCSVGLTLGLIYCLFGYRCFKMVMFFSGFMLGSAAVLLLYHEEPVLDAELGPETKAGIGLGVGVLCGLMTMLVSTMGLVLSGLQLGGLLSFAVMVVVGHFHSLAPVWAPLGAVTAAAIVTAALTLQWQKLFTVLYSSVVGAGAVMLAVDYLVGALALPGQAYDVLCRVEPPPLCWFHWAIIGIWPAMSLTGVLVQWRFTARGVTHRDDIQKKHKKKKQKFRESRRRPQRRRRPPPLKRYAGDVLAPSYLQSLQERRLGTGSSGSSISTITHTFIDFDFETGSMVPLTAAASPPPPFSV